MFIPILGSLDIPEESIFEVRFSGVNTSNPLELKEVPELIGAIESADGKHNFQEIIT